MCVGGVVCGKERLNVDVRCSVTCDTLQDANDRIAATGATGGLVGKREVGERSTVEQRCAHIHSTWSCLGSLCSQTCPTELR